MKPYVNVMTQNVINTPENLTSVLASDRSLKLIVGNRLLNSIFRGNSHNKHGHT